MTQPRQLYEARRAAARDRRPQVKLTDCRVQASAGREGHQVILEGQPVFAGAVPPRIEVGGHSLQDLAFSRDGQVAVGTIPAAPMTREAVVDYGFAVDQCAVRPAGLRDRVLHWRITSASRRKAGKVAALEVVLALILARLFLIRY